MAEYGLKVIDSSGNVYTDKDLMTKLLTVVRITTEYYAEDFLTKKRGTKLWAAFVPDNPSMYDGGVRLFVRGNSVQLENENKLVGNLMVGVR